MLMIANSLQALSFSGLMEVYEEGNRENGAERWPRAAESVRIHNAEQEFYQYLREVFFACPGAMYAVWVEKGRYCSALRLEPYLDGLLLEALETAPELRRRGYGKRLVRAVQEHFSNQGRSTRVYSHILKSNIPSLKLHEACGFRRILDYAVYIDGSLRNNACTLRWETLANNEKV